MEEERNIAKEILGWAVVLLAVILLWNSFYIVKSGQAGIERTNGAATGVTDAGLHLKIPIFQSVVKADIQTQKAHAPSEAGTRDMQIVSTAVALNYHLDRSQLSSIYTHTGLDVEDRIIDPRIQEVVKASVAKYSADQLLAQREALRAEIASSLRASLAPYHIIVEDIQITDFSFSKTYDAAIEAKQTAEQNALKAKNDLDRIKVEAEQRVTTASAEAQAIKIQSEAIKENGGAEYVRLKAIEKWNGELPKYTGAGPVPFISIDK